jgi:hypothetical protein
MGVVGGGVSFLTGACWMGSRRGALKAEIGQ